MVADVAWHDEGGRNPHAHILLTMRQIDRDDFGPKVRKWNDKKTLTGWREAWADRANRALEAHGSPERIDHRTLEAQRIDAEARGDREAALRLDRPPTVHRGKVLTHNPGAAPDHHLRFADAEAERRVAIALAEETIQLEARIASGAAEQKRLFRELDEAANDAIIDTIPEATRAEGLAHAAQPPRALRTPPTIEGQVLAAERTDRVEKRAAAEAAERNRRLLDAIPEATRAEGLAHAAQPPRALRTPPTIEGQVLAAERTDRVEKRAAAEAAERNRRLLDAIPEATRAEGLAHAAQPPRALRTPPTIEGQVLAAERTDRVEKRAAAEAAEAAKKVQAAAAEATRHAQTRFELVQSRVMVYAPHAVATQNWRPAPTRALCLAAQDALAEHAAGDRYAATPQVAGAPLAVGQLRQDLEPEILEILADPKPRARGARIPPPEPEAVASLVQKVRDLADRLIQNAAKEQGLDLDLSRAEPVPTAAPADEQPAPPPADTPAAQDIERPPADDPYKNPKSPVRGEGEGAGGLSVKKRDTPNRSSHTEKR